VTKQLVFYLSSKQAEIVSNFWKEVKTMG